MTRAAWKILVQYEPGLYELEQRMKGYINFIEGYYTMHWMDIERWFGIGIDMPERDELCTSKAEQDFNQRLLLLVGPGAMHPMVKEPDCYTVARQHLFRRFPVCGAKCECQTVLVGF